MNEKESTKKLGKSEIALLIVLAVSVLILAIFLCLRTSVEISEYFTKKVSAPVTGVLAKIGSAFHNSIFEVFVVICLCLSIIFLVVLIVFLCKKKFRKALKLFCLIGSICFLFGSFYMLVTGFAYNRKPVEKLYTESVEYQEFYKIVKYFKADYDYLANKMNRDENGMSISPYDYDELNAVLKNEVKRLDSYYNVDSCYDVKPLKIMSEFFANNGISGITFIPTGDCGVNKNQPSVEITYTALHEMMHSIGVMKENEANAVSCYLLISSENEYLRYCGYFGYYGYLLQALSLNYDKDEYSAVKVNEKVGVELNNVYEYWNSQSSFFDKVGDFFNDIYLKLSGQTDGTGSYREPTSSGGVEKVEGDRTFVEVNYNLFQQAFIKTYFDKIGG